MRTIQSAFVKQLIPAGMYQAVCFNVWYLGWQEIVYQGKPKKQFLTKIGWEINEPIPDGELKGERFRIYKDFNMILGEKSNLEKLIVNWRGYSITPQERKEQIELDDFIGKNCMLNIIHKLSKTGNEYHAIGSVNALPKGITNILPNSKRETPDWIKEIINKQITPPHEQPAAESEIFEEKEDEEIPF